MNFSRRVWIIGNALLLLAALISFRVIYWQIVRANDLRPVALNPVEAAADYAKLYDRSDPLTEEAIEFLMAEGQMISLEDLPQPVIQRTAVLMGNIQRGTIYDRRGEIVAYDTVNADGVRTRVYPIPAFAHLTGYVTGIRTGATGLELSYNRTLLGFSRVDSQVSRLIHQPLTGSDLVLTVDSGLQRLAEQSLGSHTGSVVILEGETGAILAMASTPSYDPNRIFEDDYVSALLAGCSSSPGCSAPFLNRSTQARYPPGSTWKTVTLIAALDSGLVTPETVFDFGEPLTDANGKRYYVYMVDGYPIPDPNHQESRLSLAMSYAKSANAAFARMGDEMGPTTFVDYATRLGFVAPGEVSFPIEISFVPSQLANNVNDLHSNDVLRASTAIGQGELLVTPLNMAMVVLSIINEGDIPMPHLVHHIHEPSGLDLAGPLRRVAVRDVMSVETARQVREMMVVTVLEGGGHNAMVEGLEVGGKTGTAQVGGDLPPHAWFIGFASNGEKTVVIAVVLEHGGEGSQTAAPIFAQLALPALAVASTPIIQDIP